MSNADAGDNRAGGDSSLLGYATPAAPSETVVVWCRLLALLMFGFGVIGATADLMFLLGSLFSGAQGNAETVVVSALAGAWPGIVWLLLAWYCWRRAPKLAQRISRGLNVKPTQGGMNSDELLHIITIGVGIYLLTDGLPAVGRLIYRMIEVMRAGGFIGWDGIESFIPAMIRCGLGFWLILGTQGVVRLVRGQRGRWHDGQTQEPL